MGQKLYNRVPRGTSYSLVQTLLLYNVSFSLNAHSYRQTDGQTNNIIVPIADRIAV